MVKEIKPLSIEEVMRMRPRRSCGHPIDAINYFYREDGMVELYCVPCIYKIMGIKPCETIPVKEFIEKYLGGKMK